MVSYVPSVDWKYSFKNKPNKSSLCLSFQNSKKPQIYIQVCIGHFYSIKIMILNALKECTLKTGEFASETGLCYSYVNKCLQPSKSTQVMRVFPCKKYKT